MQTGDCALRFTLARSVNLVAVSSGPRPATPDALPAHVRLIDLATAGELAELAASSDAPSEPVSEADAEPEVDVTPDPGGLDVLIARAEARLIAIRARSGHSRT